MEPPLESTVPVIFNDIALPPSVYWMELLRGICPSLSAGTAEWLLDMQYCSGSPRTAPSERVLVCAEEVEDTLLKNHAAISFGLSECLPAIAPEKLITEWVRALWAIKLSAARVPECSWSRPSFVDKSKLEQMLAWLDRNRPD